MFSNFLLFALLVLVTTFCEAADQSKYRTCDQTSFCRRQRNGNNIDLSSKLSRSNIEVNKDGFVGYFGDDKEIVLRISRVIGNSIRIEAKERNRQRYQINDVLMANARQSVGFDDVSQNEDKSRAIFKWFDTDNDEGYEMVVEVSPFRVIISNDGQVQMVVNNNEMFYFETDSFVEDGYDRENDPDSLFTERFKGHTYHYDKGPCGIGLDFTFADSKYVYGIPEHASSFALKSTRGEGSGSASGVGAYDEPFRLWNLDVFEYDLDLPAALYGAIPFVMSHSIGRSNGLFWLNGAETYVDIWDGLYLSKHSKNIRWMSEYGILEAYVILGGNENTNEQNRNRHRTKNKSHRKVLSQYGKITGTSCLPPLFSLAHHQCRWNYNNIDDVIGINNEFNARNAPNDVIWLDIEHTDGKKYFTWDGYNFAPDAKNRMIEKVYNEGKRRMVTIVDPHIKKDTNYYIYNDIESRDLWVKTRDNNNYDGFCWPGDSRYPDFSNVKMRQFWQDQFAFDKYDQSTQHLFTWNDMNEPSVFNGPEITFSPFTFYFCLFVC